MRGSSRLAPGIAGRPAPRTPTASAISLSDAKGAIRRPINPNAAVPHGPCFGARLKPGSNIVRCEVEFKAALYRRCGRVSVRSAGQWHDIGARPAALVGCPGAPATAGLRSFRRPGWDSWEGQCGTGARGPIITTGCAVP